MGSVSGSFPKGKLASSFFMRFRCLFTRFNVFFTSIDITFSRLPTYFSHHHHYPGPKHVAKQFYYYSGPGPVTVTWLPCLGKGYMLLSAIWPPPLSMENIFMTAPLTIIPSLQKIATVVFHGWWHLPHQHISQSLGERSVSRLSWRTQAGVGGQVPQHPLQHSHRPSLWLSCTVNSGRSDMPASSTQATPHTDFHQPVTAETAPWMFHLPCNKFSTFSPLTALESIPIYITQVSVDSKLTKSCHPLLWGIPSQVKLHSSPGYAGVQLLEAIKVGVYLGKPTFHCKMTAQECWGR